MIKRRKTGCLKWRFVTDCTMSTLAKLQPMLEAKKEITWATFRKYVEIVELRRHPLFRDYSYRGELLSPSGEPTIPRHLKDDIGVTFYKSVYEGRPCVFIQHSAIEFIFQEDEDEH